MLNQIDLDFLTKRLPFWENLSKGEQEDISSNTVLLQYKQGTNIHSADKECVGVLIVKRGELRTYILSEDGKEITLYRLNSGEICILSASCLLNNITFDVYIDAEQNSDVLLINSAIFSKLMTDNIYIENFSLRLAADRFSDVMWAMEQILFMSFDRRLAIFLLDEAAKSGANYLKFTHEQIAKYIGSAREVVSRMLKYFEGEGIVTLHRGGIDIINKDKLKNLLT